VTLRLVTYYGCVWDYDTGHTVFIHLPDPDDSRPIFKCTKVKDILATDADKAKAISSGHEQLWLVHSSGAKRVSLSEGEEAVREKKRTQREDLLRCKRHRNRYTRDEA